jgi:hypothetical protein
MIVEGGNGAVDSAGRVLDRIQSERQNFVGNIPAVVFERRNAGESVEKEMARTVQSVTRASLLILGVDRIRHKARRDGERVQEITVRIVEHGRRIRGPVMPSPFSTSTKQRRSKQRTQRNAEKKTHRRLEDSREVHRCSGNHASDAWLEVRQLE